MLAASRGDRAAGFTGPVRAPPAVSHGPAPQRGRGAPSRRHRHHALNPPRDGMASSTNPPNGGPADTDVTKWIQDPPSDILQGRPADIARIPFSRAMASTPLASFDFREHYVADLGNVLNMDAIKGVRIGGRPAGRCQRGLLGRDRRALRPGPHGGQSVGGRAVRIHDPGLGQQIRMDCSSPSAMASLVTQQRRLRHRHRQRHRLRPPRHHHPDGGLMNPNHFLSVAIESTCTRTGQAGRRRPAWARRWSVPA